MKTQLLHVRVSLFLWLTFLPFCTRVDAQTVTVIGTVTASSIPVRNASVTFADASAPANSVGALTDSAGHYRVALVLTSVEPPARIPSSFRLEQNYPNPFTSSTVVPYELKSQSDIEVTIYDILGRVVRRISAGTQPPGTHSILWDGKNAVGSRVSSGIYFYTMRAGGESLTKRMVLGAGGSGVAPLLQAQAPAAQQSVRGMAAQTVEKVFTVTVADTTGTSPLIVAAQIMGVVVRGDTTVDCPVTQLPVAAITPDSVQQYIRGFGAANIIPWRPDMTSAQVQAAFGAGPGQLGFTILRLRIPSTDLVSDFSANLPSAQMAESLGAIVFASPWSPPAALKTNNNIVGGMLNDTSYASFAAHLKSFADYMSANGAPLYAVSLQNEPDANVTYESCTWNATQFLNFTKNNAASVGTRIMMPESQNFVHALSDSTLNDPAAAANVTVVGGHIYGGGLGPYPLAVSKGKEVWMTEHLVTDTTWVGVLGTGMEINNCMNAGMSAYVWWYIVRYYGPVGEDGTITKRGYAMSQFSKFIRPGYHRIKCSSAFQRNVNLSAYRDSTTSRVVIIAINSSASPVQQGFSVAGGTMTSFASYTTSQAKNCQQGADVPASAGTFVATLDPSSIMTFVSK